MARLPLLAFTSVAAIALATQPAHAQHDYFFGDSDLEQGNFQRLAGTSAEDNAPYYCDGGLCRDSNGPVWAERLSPGVMPVLAAPSFNGSLNFAVSGAHMTDRGDPSLPVDTGVTRQIARFAALQDKGAIRVGGGDRFFLHAGTNDLTRLLAGDSPDAIRADIVSAATDHVATLAGRGARTIVVATVQPVQYLPLFGEGELAGLRDAMGGFVAGINTDLVASLARLRPRLAQGTNLILVDQQAFFERLRTGYLALGFTSFDTPCYDADAGKLCAQDRAGQSARVFFDSNHFSAKGHVLLADWYRATLDGASGEAARGAARTMDALFTGARDIARETDAARALAAGPGDRFGLFAAPLLGTVRYAEAGLHLRQRGGLIGVQGRLGANGFVALSGAWLEQRARGAGADRFTMREWSVSGAAGITLGGARVALHASYARPRVEGFARDTHALGVVATGETRGTRYAVGIEAAGSTMLLPGLRLSSRSRLDYAHGTLDGFAEGNATGLALGYGRQSAGLVTLDTQTRLSLALAGRTDGFALTPYVELDDREQLHGRKHRIGSTLLDNLANPASTEVWTLAGQGMALRGGVEAALGKVVRLDLSYARSFTGPGERSDGVAARIAFVF
ncbi:SGNH/GDSL hydrolase family protein [Sphingomonas kyeonggiensis]|uniref:Phospholipase/lecithinase/hemolysin n=1 Tax=Sphingomonas kyeonggiensis TaxID=1268553 RepID=A0A7W6JWU0_9SPHN|nr:SGNH/GDSL hydrolase family protein [Sphingomonas kyeonggiensis]MBB4100975.1 phospholipase/lecithinase/hemolysin [Sphingomonas kyeonggiensis]